MKHLSLLCLLYILSATHLFAQQTADEQAAELLQRQDLFEIQAKYPPLAGQVKNKVIKHMLNVLLYANTNRIALVHAELDSIFKNHPNEIGPENVSNLVLMKAVLLAHEGYYAKAVDWLDSFLQQSASHPDTAQLAPHRAVASLYRPMYKLPRPEVVRPQHDVEIPFMREPAGKGTMMRVNVRLNGKVYRFILDTGANFTYVHERFAREAGLKILKNTSISVGHGMLGQVESRLATADSLMVGDIVFRNPLIYVGPANEKLDSIYYVDAVLGADFLHQLPEMQIDNEQYKIRFPLESTPCPATGPNMLYSELNFRIKVEHEDETLFFLLDTGDAAASLSTRYYENHRHEVDAKAIPDSIGDVSTNVLKQRTAKSLPEFTLELGGKPVTLHNLTIHTSSANHVGDFPNSSGSLGQQFVTAFKRLTLNFKDGFVSGEPY